MTRDPELDKAILDLRPTFAELRRAKSQLKHAEVKASLNKTAAVKSVVFDCYELIAVRASHLGISRDGLVVILSAYARERGRLKKWPSVKQVTMRLQRDRTDSVLQVKVTREALVKAKAAAAQALADDAAAKAACIAFTGYAS